MDTLLLRDFFMKLNTPHTKIIVCAIDELPQRKLNLKHERYKNLAFVINLSKKTEYGSHWVALFITRGRHSTTTHGYFLDSYAFKPRSFQLTTFIQRNCTQVTYPTQQLQQLRSNVCGMYAACFIAHMSSGYSFDTFIAKFSKNLLINDYIIVKIYNNFHIT